MADITGTYGNARIIPIVQTPIEEDHLETTAEKGSGASSPSSATDRSTQSRTESDNNIYIEESIVSAFVEQEEEAREKCIKVLGLELTEKLHPTTITYKKLERIYKIDKIARQKFYQAVRKSGAQGLHLGSKLDPRYQTKTYLLTIEQDTRKFFLDSPFGRRSIKSPKNITKLFDNCCISEQETFRATVRVVFYLFKLIFPPYRIDQTDPFTRLEDYLEKKWHRINIDPLNEIDEHLGVHYNPMKNNSASKMSEYSNSPLFRDFQIQDIEKKLHYRQDA